MNNISSPEKSLYGITQQLDDLFCNDYFFSDTQNYILVYVRCAEYFLNKILSNEIVINDENTVRALYLLKDKMRGVGASHKSIKELYVKVLNFIEVSVSDNEVDNTENEETILEYYDYGPYSFFYNGMCIVRNVALATYVASMAKHLKSIPEITDLNGENYIRISNVKHLEMIEFLGPVLSDPTKFDMALFTKVKEGVWRLEFNGLGMGANHYIYQREAYRSICDLLKYMLKADVEAVSHLQEYMFD